MADEQHEIRHIRWNEVFSFTQVFKSFGLAIHPSKLAMALAAIVVIFLGGWLMDRAWSVGKAYVMPAHSGVADEITAFTQMPSADFNDQVKSWKESRAKKAEILWGRWEREKQQLTRFRSAFAGKLGISFGKLLNEANQGLEVKQPEAAENIPWPRLLKDAQEAFEDSLDRAEKLLEDAKKDVAGTIDILPGEEKRNARKELEEELTKARQKLTAMRLEFNEEVEGIRGRPVFASLLSFEANCVHSALNAVRYGRIFTGLSEYGTSTASNVDKGFLFFGLLALHGVLWLICNHLLFAIIFLVFSLAVWALFAGAICRISALHAARDEKISMGQALRFSAGKFFSFFAAPLIPLFIIVFIGALIFLGSLLANIPVVGPIILGLGFLLAILGGLLITFLLFGLVGGGALMYPTIAVEGSDSFDAISRSYSYIFKRPWRAGLYSLAAVVYGSLCYLFVRLFAFISLKVTHVAVKMGVFTGGEGLEGASDKIDVMWAAPTFGNLHGGITPGLLPWYEAPAAWLLCLWVYLVVGVVVAFLISYYCSATTIIYYLLRRQVDATDFDDVYVAEAHEEQFEPAPAEPQQGDVVPEPVEDQGEEGKEA